MSEYVFINKDGSKIATVKWDTNQQVFVFRDHDRYSMRYSPGELDPILKSHGYEPIGGNLLNSELTLSQEQHFIPRPNVKTRGVFIEEVLPYLVLVGIPAFIALTLFIMWKTLV